MISTQTDQLFCGISLNKERGISKEEKSILEFIIYEIIGEVSNPTSRTGDLELVELIREQLWEI